MKLGSPSPPHPTGQHAPPVLGLSQTDKHVSSVAVQPAISPTAQKKTKGPQAMLVAAK